MGVVPDMEAEQRSAGRHRRQRSPPLPLNPGTIATWRHSTALSSEQRLLPHLSSCYLYDAIETEALTTMSASSPERFGLEGQCVSVAQGELGPGEDYPSGRSTNESERGRSPSGRGDESTQPVNQWVIASG